MLCYYIIALIGTNPKEQQVRPEKEKRPGDGTLENHLAFGTQAQAISVTMVPLALRTFFIGSSQSPSSWR
jgi:hypothetical protein